MAEHKTAVSSSDTRGQRETHVDTRSIEKINEFFDDMNPYAIEKLPKLEGMVLQWHRVKNMGEDDTKNVMKSISKGWRPVMIDTLNQAAKENGFDTPYLPTTKFSEQEGVVGTHDLILMTIPQAHFDAYKRSLQKRVDLQQQSQETIFNDSLNKNIPSAFVSPMKRGNIPIIDD